MIIICNEKNYTAIFELLFRNNYYGVDEQYVKLVIEDKTIPLIDRQGKLCISFEEKTLSFPAGTAMAVPKVLEERIKSFLECNFVEYLHFVGCENIAEMPGDPLTLGLMHKFKKKVAGKCVAPTSLYQQHPRYVASKKAFYLLGRPTLTQI